MTAVAIGRTLCFASLLIAGCSQSVQTYTPSAPSTPVVAAATDLLGFDEIKLTRSACYGQCPVYELWINRDGSMAYNGIEYVRLKGEQTAKLAPTELSMLAANLKWANFGVLKSLDKCPEIATDNPRVKLSLTLNGITDIVDVSAACEHSDKFRRFMWLADTIDLITQSEDWVRGKAVPF